MDNMLTELVPPSQDGMICEPDAEVLKEKPGKYDWMVSARPKPEELAEIRREELKDEMRRERRKQAKTH